MRLTTVLAAARVVLVTMSATACSNRSKTSAAAPTTSAPSPAAAASATPSTVTGAANTGASSGVNVCSLLTAAQASSITGATYTTATASFGAGGNSCLYASGAMDVTVTPNAGSSAAWTDELSTLQLGGGETPATISGVGDRAATSTGALGTQSGTWIIQVDAADEGSVNGGDIGGDLTKSIAVAKAIIAALH